MHHIDVRSITFDGAANNIGMAPYFGACLDITSDNFQPFFHHPVTNKKIYLLPDPSHMLKNVRNSFGSTSANKNHSHLMYDNEGRKISWQYIQQLVDLQICEGLRAANKLTKRHVLFKENPMNVLLAAQTLSESTAAALEYLQSHDMKDFRMQKELPISVVCSTMPSTS